MLSEVSTLSKWCITSFKVTFKGSFSSVDPQMIEEVASFLKFLFTSLISTDQTLLTSFCFLIDEMLDLEIFCFRDIFTMTDLMEDRFSRIFFLCRVDYFWKWTFVLFRKVLSFKFDRNFAVACMYRWYRWAFRSRLSRRDQRYSFNTNWLLNRHWTCHWCCLSIQGIRWAKGHLWYIIIRKTNR